MSQVLSQDEVDALLKGISDGEVGAETDEPIDESGITSYDLTRGRVIRGRMPTLEVINQRFAREFRTSLSNILRRTVDINVLATETMKFEDFFKSLPVPTSIHIVRLENLRGTALVVLESRLVFTIIDALFGGTGAGTTKIEGKDFTAIEDKVMKRIVHRLIEVLEESWKNFHKIGIKFLRSEINPQFAIIVPPTDVVVVISFEVELEQSTGNITLCIPYSTIEPIKEKLSAGFQSDQLGTDQSWLSRIKEHLKRVPANITVELGRSEIKGRELLNLQVGDVIQLEKDCTDELDVRVEENLKFRGYPGILKGNKALQISSIFMEGENIK
ncbi:MAG TPA: flagellar motor switch protein FliM [Nitrospinota bacterium]|nr:flagellar motor switch protein FliM [Nitrospinota bacterium]